LLFAFLLLESADVELEVELESSLLELDSVVLLEVADVDDELLMPCMKQTQQWEHFFDTTTCTRHQKVCSIYVRFCVVV
jgi:hypothetical protein